MKIKKIMAILFITCLFLFTCACGCKHEWQSATCTLPMECISCGERSGEPLGHQFEDATCTSPKTCAVCGESVGESLEHNYVEATYYKAKHCKICGESIGRPLEKLSANCDFVVCDGYNENGDYYELVVNQIDEYPSSTFQVGVIKNNAWIVELGSTCPFLDEEGWWKGLDKSYETNKFSEEDFQFLGQGIFLYKGKVIYNSESGYFFENLTNRDYSGLINSTEFVGFESNREGNNHYIKFKYFNIQTGETREIKGYFENVQRPDKLYDISDGLFYAEGETWTWENFQYTKYSGFFDLNGNMILDLSVYNITDYHGYTYKNGTYTITCKNDSGVNFYLTFDTSGNIISQEKSEHNN